MLNIQTEHFACQRQPPLINHEVDRSRRKLVTVCVAALCSWKYPDETIGKAVIAASDRMITAGDIEYESQQLKVCFATSHAIILIAGDYPIHSEALIKMQRSLIVDPTNDIGEIANRYGAEIRNIRSKQASNIYLSPLGLDQNSFIEKQALMNPALASDLSIQLQNYNPFECEALIVGCENLIAHIYHVDRYGNISCQDDVGFAAIGIGAWHAKSQIMLHQFSSSWIYHTTLALIYMAKSRSEIAPGVGRTTDMVLITRDGHERIFPQTIEKLQELYREYEDKRRILEQEIAEKLLQYGQEKRKDTPAT